MWCASITMKESKEGINTSDIRNKIDKINRQLSRTENDINRQQLQQADAEYQRILTRHQDLETRTIAMEAKMESLIHGFEEIYQRLISGQFSSSTDIQEALQRLRLEEELDMAVNTEMNMSFQPEKNSPQKKRRQKEEQSRKI